LGYWGALGLCGVLFSGVDGSGRNAEDGSREAVRGAGLCCVAVVVVERKHGDSSKMIAMATVVRGGGYISDKQVRYTSALVILPTYTFSEKFLY
jgi:hypothetical protein